MAPRSSRIAVVLGAVTAADGGSYYLRMIAKAGASAGVEIIATPVHDTDEIERAIENICARSKRCLGHHTRSDHYRSSCDDPGGQSKDVYGPSPLLAVTFQNLVAGAANSRPLFFQASQDRKIPLIDHLGAKPHHVRFAGVLLAFRRRTCGSTDDNPHRKNSYHKKPEH